MKKLFVHQPFFRILSPIFSGVIVYLLILLLNNDVEQLQEQFLGEELYVCIGLSYIVQEFSRLLLLLFKRIFKGKTSLPNLILQGFVSLASSIGLVTLSVWLYYKYVVGFSATPDDIFMFNSVFAVITLIYILLFVSHQYLYKINTERLQQEEIFKQSIEEDFRQFERGINPHLLFESLEALITLMYKDTEKAEDFIDSLASIYRYVLSNKDKQLISYQEEFQHLKQLESLLNQLPYRKLKLINEATSDFLVVPGSLLFVMEMIVRKTIISTGIELLVVVKESEKTNQIQFEYKTQDRINSKISVSDLKDIRRVYSIYSNQAIEIEELNATRTVSIPKLTIKETE